jgi:hypothetical protein
MDTAAPYQEVFQDNVNITANKRLLKFWWNRYARQFAGDDAKDLPSTFITKVAWPSRLNFIEAAVFAGLGKEMGVPILIAHQQLDDTKFLFGDGVEQDEGDEIWNVFGSAHPPFIEIRVRCVMYYATEGTRLDQAETLGQVFEGVFHAMLGSSATTDTLYPTVSTTELLRSLRNVVKRLSTS